MECADGAVSERWGAAGRRDPVWSFGERRKLFNSYSRVVMQQNDRSDLGYAAITAHDAGGEGTVVRPNQSPRRAIDVG